MVTLPTSAAGAEVSIWRRRGRHMYSSAMPILATNMDHAMSRVRRMLIRCLVLGHALVMLAVAGDVMAQPQTIRLGLPVEGELGRDVWIINHVDNAPAEGAVRDFTCGRQTYDGHQGTDFALRSFRQMDSGAYVIATAAGRVITVIDSLFDRNKRVDRSLGLGNFVAIQHPEGVATYYAHIRRGSALVRVGDSVTRGQRIALIGSSGTSEDPHLHFEVWMNVDPFSGSCSARTVRWDDQPAYRNTFTLIDADVTTWPPLLDTLRERPPSATTILKQDTSVTFWSLQQHVQSADRLGVTWLTPDNEVWFRYEADAGVESSYLYWWSWIRRPTSTGLWRVEYRMNDTIVTTRTFRVLETVSAGSEGSRPGIELRRFGDVLRYQVPVDCKLLAYDVQGRLVSSYAMPSGRGAIIAELPAVTLVELVLHDGAVLARLIVGSAPIHQASD